MPFNFPPPPHIEGLTFLDIRPVVFTDQRIGRRLVFPIYNFRDDITGELVRVVEPQYEAIMDKLIAMGTLASRGVQ